jgi:hypothetical protein
VEKNRFREELNKGKGAQISRGSKLRKGKYTKNY